MRQSVVWVWWEAVDHPRGRFLLAATAIGLCALALPGEPETAFVPTIRRYVPGARLARDPRRTGPYRRELLEYLEGRRQAFTIPVDLRGTAFQQRVWQAIQTIPYGTVVTYSELARRLGRPTAARAVGGACRANPVPVVVPCHRVVGTQGVLTGYRGGLDLKATLLQLEQRRPDDSLTRRRGPPPS